MRRSRRNALTSRSCVAAIRCGVSTSSGPQRTADFRPGESDFDFLVEFESPEAPDYADRFLGLMFGLEDLLGRPVDLVVDSVIRNPYFRKAVDETRVPLYAREHLGLMKALLREG